jgi:hypothetical protein
MKRLLFPLLATFLVLSVLPAAPVAAATFRNLIDQDPASPTDVDSVILWIESDTAFGETAGVEYKIGSTYVKLLCSYDVSGPAPANWRAELPPQPAGTLVEYQLYTRNEFGQDYGFTGFNWAYFVDAPVPTRQTTFGAIKALHLAAR